MNSALPEFPGIMQDPNASSGVFGTSFLVVWYHAFWCQTSSFGTRGLHNIPWARFAKVGARCCWEKHLAPTVANRHSNIHNFSEHYMYVLPFFFKYTSALVDL
eukprot:COSAG02_NODE_4669_length_5113_cov_2.348424_1_plen_103_part_00